MVWYFATFAAVATTFYAYRKRRSIHRLGNDEVGDLARLLGTDFGVAMCGSFALLFVLLSILLTNPSGAVLKENARSQEIEDYRYLGKKLAIRTYSAAKTAPKKIIVISRELGDKGKPYHDAMIDGIKQGLQSQSPKAGSENRVPEMVIELVPRITAEADSDREQTRLLTLENRFMDAICAKHLDVSAVICLVPVHHDFTDCKTAQEVRDGQKVFALYTDNVYHLGEAIAYNYISFCVTNNPLYRPEKVPPEATQEERFTARFLPPIGKNNLRVLAGKHRKLFYTTKRLD